MHKLRDSLGKAEADLRRRIERLAGKGRIYVLGLGNTDRGDDGAGILVAIELKKDFPSFVYSEHDGVEGIVLDLSERKEDAAVFFVDAAELGLEPGSLKLVPREEIKDTEITTHRVAVALLTSMLELSGKRVAVICVQPKSIEFRGKVSSEVERAVSMIASALSHSMAKADA